MAIDAPVVDVGAVGRAGIAQHPYAVLGLDLGVLARHELVVQHDGALRIGPDRCVRRQREQLAALRALQRDDPAQQLHAARAAERIDDERLGLGLDRRRLHHLLRDLRAVRTLVPALVELLLALRAELLGEDPEPARDDRRIRTGTCRDTRHSWHSLRHLGHPLPLMHLASLLLLLTLLSELLRAPERVASAVL